MGSLIPPTSLFPPFLLGSEAGDTSFALCCYETSDNTTASLVKQSFVLVHLIVLPHRLDVFFVKSCVLCEICIVVVVVDTAETLYSFRLSPAQRFHKAYSGTS